jgi:transposase
LTALFGTVSPSEKFTTMPGLETSREQLGMYQVEKYTEIRIAVMKDGMSIRKASRHFGVSRQFIDKAIGCPIPKPYSRQKKTVSKLDPFKDFIDAILEEDKYSHKKQKHTAKRIFERLREEEGYSGGYTLVKNYLQQKKRKSRESFIPLAHPPGDAQVDFGEADIYLNGKLERCHYFAMTLPYSNATFVKAYPLERTESFLDGHISAFEFFGKVPQRILYDNASIMVKKIEEDKTREVTDAFLGLVSHYLLDYKFANVASGNEKGHVEGNVGYTRRNFMVPIPRVRSYEELNAHLQEQCNRFQYRRVRGKTKPINELLQEDLMAMNEKPAYPIDPSTKRAGAVSSTLLVRFDTNDYSVPFEYTNCDISIKAYWDEIKIYYRDELIASHQRLFGREGFSYNPMHYLKLLERKPGALEQAAPLKDWKLPQVFQKFKSKLESRLKRKGKLEFIQTLRLLEIYDVTEIEIAIEEALRLQTVSVDAVKILADSLRENSIPNLNMDQYPHIPNIQVKQTQVSDYMILLEKAAS